VRLDEAICSNCGLVCLTLYEHTRVSPGLCVLQHVHDKISFGLQGVLKVHLNFGAFLCICGVCVWILCCCPYESLSSTAQLTLVSVKQSLAVNLLYVCVCLHV